MEERNQAGGEAYNYECPGKIYLLGVEMIAEERKHARDNKGGDQLAEQQEMEGKGRIARRLL